MKSNINREQKKLLEDLEFCDMAVEMRSDDDNAHFNKAQILSKLGKFDEKYFSQAIDSYNTAIELNPENLLALCDRAKLHARLGKKEATIDDLIKVRNFCEENADYEDDVTKLYAKNTLELLKDLDATNNITNKVKLTIQKNISKINDNNDGHKNQIIESTIASFDNAALESIKQLVVEKLVTQIKIDELKSSNDRKKGDTQEELQSLKEELDKRNQEIAEIRELQSKILIGVEQNNVDINKVKMDTERLNTKFDAIERTLESFDARIEDGAEQLTTLVEDFVHEKSNTANIKSLLQGFVTKSAKDANIQKEQILKMQQQIDTKIDQICTNISTQQQDKGEKVEGVDIQAIVNSLTVQIKAIGQTVCRHEKKLDEHDAKIEEIQIELKTCATLEEFQNLKDQVKSAQVILDGKITLIEGELQGQQVQICHMNETLSNTLIHQEAEIRKGFQTLLEKNDNLVYEYANTFYWTLSNYLMACRVLSTGIVQNNIQESTLEKIVNTITKSIASSAKGVPILGGVVYFIDTALTSVYQAYKQMKFDQKIKKINEVIALNSVLEQDLTLAVAQAALEIANMRRDVITSKATKKEIPGKQEAAQKWLEEIFEKTLSKFTGVKTSYGSVVGKMVLEDVALIIGGIVIKDNTTSQQPSANNTLAQKIIDIAKSNLIESQVKVAYQDHTKTNFEVKKENPFKIPQ